MNSIHAGIYLKQAPAQENRPREQTFATARERMNKISQEGKSKIWATLECRHKCAL